MRRHQTRSRRENLFVVHVYLFDIAMFDHPSVEQTSDWWRKKTCIYIIYIHVSIYEYIVTEIEVSICTTGLSCLKLVSNYIYITY